MLKLGSAEARAQTQHPKTFILPRLNLNTPVPLFAKSKQPSTFRPRNLNTLKPKTRNPEPLSTDPLFPTPSPLTPHSLKPQSLGGCQLLGDVPFPEHFGPCPGWRLRGLGFSVIEFLYVPVGALNPRTQTVDPKLPNPKPAKNGSLRIAVRKDVQVLNPIQSVKACGTAGAGALYYTPYPHPQAANAKPRSFET